MNTKSKKPNILFLMTDEQRFDCVGYKNQAVKTPNLDKLANESVVFDRAYTSNPSCVPARAAIYTGKYPSQCGAPNFITYLPEDETTFMSLLRDNGYHTAVIGKQHFGKTGIDRGYNEEYIYDGHMPPEHIKTSNSEYGRFLLDNGFEDGKVFLEQEGRFYHRFRKEEKYHIDSFVGDSAVEWISKKQLSKPWFLAVSFPGPHMPYDGIGLPQEKIYNIDEIDMPQTCFEDLALKPQHYKQQLITGHGNPGSIRWYWNKSDDRILMTGNDETGTIPENIATADEIRKTRLAYYSNMTMIDKKIGQIINALKDKNEYDNTLIIFTSDHGDFMGDFGMMGKGQYLSEVLMRIPFLLKPPVPDFKGKLESSFISSVDIAATCLAAAGIEKPEEMISRDLNYYANKDADINDRAHIYMEAQHIRAVRTEKYKYIYYKERIYGELYDLENDPYEKHNLWNDEKYSQVKSHMQTILIDNLISLNRRSHVKWNINAPQI